MWPGKQYSNSLEDSEGMDGMSLLPTGKGNYLPSARARLQGLKQLSVEKLATLKQRIAETRSKTNFKPGKWDCIRKLMQNEISSFSQAKNLKILMLIIKFFLLTGLSDDPNNKLDCAPTPENLGSTVGDCVIFPQFARERHVLAAYHCPTQLFTVSNLFLKKKNSEI